MKHMIFDYRAETMPIEQMRELQGKRLRLMLERICQNVPMYRERLDQAGIKPADVRSIDDLSRLPFTTKEDLRNAYPLGLLAVPREEVVRLHASSGTTGKRTVVAYTQNDIGIWSKVMARTLAGAGGGPSDVIQVSYGYGLFTGGLGAHYGAERLGAVTVPTSVGNTKLQLQLIQDFGATMICCTPSYALYIAEVMEEMGISPGEISLKSGCFGAEPWTENMRKEIESRLGIKAYDIYGLSEVIGPGVAFECEAQSGMHVNEDHFIPEIVDPDTGEVLPDGTYGELVFTCVTKQAMPLLRYRTRDIAALTREECACGRTLVRMSKPTGRADDMLIIRGINVFPSQVESVLLEIAGTAPHYQIIVERQGALDTMEVLVEMTPEMFADTVREINALQQRIQNAMESILGISAKITLVAPRTIQRSEGKAVRVIDKRKLV
jgi:phenylacetate-CoA ligase